MDRDSLALSLVDEVGNATWPRRKLKEYVGVSVGVSKKESMINYSFWGVDSSAPEVITKASSSELS